MQNKNIKEVHNALIIGIKDYFNKNNFKKAVIGLSGGIDSSIAAYLITKALGSKNVTGILMPESRLTSKQSIKDAETVAKKLKIKNYSIEIDNFIDSFSGVNKKINAKKNPYALANAKARARTAILYHIANLTNALVIGTSDKSEIALGYTTKFGDNASDILVIGDLWKTDVIELGKFLKVPKNILQKKPSAELIPGQTAEKELGAAYNILDKILKLYIEDNLSSEEIIKKGFNKKIVKNTVKRVRLNEHKRRMPMILRVSEKSFHALEWRMPITNKYEG